ncbi:MAG: hypothetical protein RJA44_442, partial [Pseudomonadota bacterium]
MKSILLNCEAPDFDYLSELLDSPLTRSAQTQRRTLLLDYQSRQDIQTKKQLVALLDEQIRYFGSSDLAWLGRLLLREERGATAEQIIDDVCARLDLPGAIGGNTALRLQRLILALVEQELGTRSPAQLHALLLELGVSAAQATLISAPPEAGGGNTPLMARLLLALGPAATLSLAQTLVIRLIAALTGRQGFGGPSAREG